MRIMIIRHGKVDMKWPKKCSSSQFDLACSEYDNSDIEEVNSISLNTYIDKIYVSKLSRSKDTARGLFPNIKIYEMPEIGEVPLRSFMDTEKTLPLWIWNVLGRVQWYIGSVRQFEIRKDTIRRTNKVIDICEQGKEDCVLVTHGFFIKVLLTVLKKRGYKLFSNNQVNIKNLQVIRAEKL